MNPLSRSRGARFVGYFQPLRDFYFDVDNRKTETLDFAQDVFSDLKNELHYEILLDSLKNEPLEIRHDDIHIYDSANVKISQILAEKIKAESHRQ